MSDYDEDVEILVWVALLRGDYEEAKRILRDVTRSDISRWAREAKHLQDLCEAARKAIEP